MDFSDISVIILTYNEEMHLERCILSIKGFAKDIYVVDSHSTDRTVELAESLGAKVYSNKWLNYATQFNWALENIPINTTWVVRLDADEVFTDELCEQFRKRVDMLGESVTGIYVRRKVYFMDRWIRHGNMYPIYLLRIWRYGKGRCEERWMDEHIKLDGGETVKFTGNIIDHNKRSLGWWTEKHNGYATREVIDLLNIKYRLVEATSVKASLFGTQEERKRWLKLLYAEIPLFVRPFMYFFFRYFCKFGFLDGKEGLVWHFLQGFWYRFLVDAKIYEIRRAGGNNAAGIRQALQSIYSITV